MKHLLAISFICAFLIPSVHGETITTNEGVYVGEWKDGKMNGQGTYTWASGEKYVGEWKDNLKHGQGIYTQPNGVRYVGEFKDDLFHGQGTITYAELGKYVGEWKRGKNHGEGTFTYPNGDKYAGEFKDGLFHGQSTFTWSDGRKYVGEWKDDKVWKGVEYDKYGNAIRTLSDGVPQPLTQQENQSTNEEPSRRNIFELLKGFVMGQNNSQPDDGSAAYARGDYVKAYRQALPLAEQGDAQAQFNLASLYMDGLGVPKNPVLAAKWVEKAAIQGHYLALVVIGSMYSDGVGVLEDPRRAEYFWKQAVEKGSGDAAFGLVTLYRKPDLENRLLQYVYLKIAQALGHDGAKTILTEISKIENKSQTKYFTDNIKGKGDVMAQNIWAKIKAAREF